MVNTNLEEIKQDHEHVYDRHKELKLLDESKEGVKGLVDAGLTKVPKIFIHDKIHEHNNKHTSSTNLSIPIIDFGPLFTNTSSSSSSRLEIIEKVKHASEKWGFFQVVNHGIPSTVLDEMIDGVVRFHEQDTEVKKEFYSRDITKRAYFNTNFDLYVTPAVNWRDSLSCVMGPQPLDPQDLPTVCRDITIKYSDYVNKAVMILFELLFEALGLNSSYLKDIDCAEGLFLISHYYPPCPEPELTFGTSAHSDSSFLTVLLQDQLGGLQVFHENQWVDVTPIPSTLVVNLGDMMQTWKLWCEGKSLELIDPIHKKSYIENEVMKCIHIGLLCVQQDAADRSTMSTVIAMLGSDTMPIPKPKQPAFSVGRVTEDDPTLKSYKDNYVDEVPITIVSPR